MNDVLFMIVCEEAHNYVPRSGSVDYAASKKSIERIAKEGRIKCLLPNNTSAVADILPTL